MKPFLFCGILTAILITFFGRFNLINLSIRFIPSNKVCQVNADSVMMATSVFVKHFYCLISPGPVLKKRLCRYFYLRYISCSHTSGSG